MCGRLDVDDRDPLQTLGMGSSLLQTMKQHTKREGTKDSCVRNQKKQYIQFEFGKSSILPLLSKWEIHQNTQTWNF